MSGNWGRVVGVGEKRQKGSDRSAAAAAAASCSPARPNSGEAELGLWFGESVGEGTGERGGG